MLKSSFSDYSDTCILGKGTITIAGAGADAAARNTDEIKTQVAFENYAPFSNRISQINNTQVDNAEYLDIMRSMHNVIENSNN